MNEIKEVGFLGLGNMGINMVKNLLDKGFTVHAWNRSPEPREMAELEGAKVYESISDLLKAYQGKPRIIFSMVSAGSAVDKIIKLLVENPDPLSKLQEGDIFIDGVNSFYKDTTRRAEELKKLQIRMIDIGVSGGITGARTGASIMAGGDKSAYDIVEPLLASLAQEKGYGYFGTNGAGHYVKMIHNGIEYGMMQSIGEGVNLLEASEYKVDLAKLTEVWNNGSIIEGKLIGFLNSGLQKNSDLSQVSETIGSLGTGEWTVKDALEKNVPLNAITSAVFERFSSRGNSGGIRKIVQMLRAEFGGHNDAERPDGAIKN